MAFDLLKAVREAAPGATIQVPAGTYPLNLEVGKPLTLIAEGIVVLDGQKKDSCLRVVGGTTEVKVVGFRFFEGAAECGGGVFHAEGKLTLQDCRFERNSAPMYGGGGLYTAGERCVVIGCRFTENTGRQGGAVLADNLVHLSIRDSLLAQNAATEGGALRAREAATVDLLGCTLADNKVVGDKAQGSALFVSGTMTRQPVVSLVNCIVTERAKGPALIHNPAPHPAQLAVRRCLLSESATAFAGDNLFTADPRFSRNEREPYALHFKSPAVGAGDASVYGEGAKDLRGKDRVQGGKAEPGAFAASR
ncbi:MAG: hypothetical protein H6Q89_4210 [Myxococcaceae bacterium]|nr:hypothetical protein [Myxococcaceae bacterium]